MYYLTPIGCSKPRFIGGWRRLCEYHQREKKDTVVGVVRAKRLEPPGEAPSVIFNSSPETIRLDVMMYVRVPLSPRHVEGLLSERGIDICHETVRFWRNRFGPLFAAGIPKRRVHQKWYSNWRQLAA